jgi:hypothetical protein
MRACLRFALYASSAWLATLLGELSQLGAIGSRTPGRLGYLSALALAYSALCLPVLGLLHASRRLLLLRIRHADAVLCLLLSAALVPPGVGRARLLTGGSVFLDSPYALPLQLAISSGCIAAFLAIWVSHLALCLPQGAPLFGKARSPRPKLRLVWFAAGALLVCAFAYGVDARLRNYNFLVSFAMPGVWLLSASLWAGWMQRSAMRRSWLVLQAAVLLGCAAYGVVDPTAVRTAHAELVRLGGLAAVCEATRHFAAPPAYANLGRGPAAGLRCPARTSLAYGDELGIASERRRNVILISIDALRQDALGKRLTPALDAFAARSLRFSRAITPYPATLFALGAALTGLYPSELLLAPDSLQDILQLTASSWDRRVAIWPDAFWFRRSALPALLTRSLNPQLWHGARSQTDRLLSELRLARAAGQRTFAWIHYYEPHLALGREAQQQLGGSPRSRYEALVAAVDREFGRLIREIERLGYLEDSLILVFGDHGEALGELGYYGHHLYLNQFLGDVPLLLHAPGVAAGSSNRLASLIDIAPTVLAWTHTAAPAFSDARSLFDVARSSDERYGLSEAFPVRGRLLFESVRAPITTLAMLEERLSLVRSGTVDYQPKVALVSAHERLIVNRTTGDEEFYDRDADPDERDDRSQRELPAHARMRSALTAAMQRMSQRIFCRVSRP